MFICLSCFLFYLALTQARTRPSPNLPHPTGSIETATGPSPNLPHPTVSIEAATGPSPTLAHPSVSTELDDSTLLAEATRLEEAHVIRTFILI